jgi:hypothetical protein
MEIATAASRRSVFLDGLGKRHAIVGSAGEPLEVFELRDDFSRAPAFEAALRERVSALSGFQNSCFSRVRTVHRPRQYESKLVVLSSGVQGVRLSSVLDAAKTRGKPLELNAALCLVRQVVPAIAMLHEKMPGVAHGAISPDRLVITPQSRIVVVDHMLGSALELMNFPREKYWNELGIALPQAERVAIDQRVDVLQIGIMALSLILGRTIEAHEYPESVATLADGAWCSTPSGGVQLLPAEFRIWLRRMLQLEEQSFASAVEAWAELEQVLHTGDPMGSFAAFEAFMAEHLRETQREVEPVRHDAEPKPAAAAAAPAAPPEAAATPPVAKTPAVATPQTIAPTPIATPAMAPAPTPASGSHPAVAVAEPAPSPKPIVNPARVKFRVQRQWVAAAAIIIAIVSAGVISVRRYGEVMPAAVAEATGTLVVDSTPNGVRVLVDGQTRGVTPLTVQLSPGAHDVILAGEGDPRTINVNMTAGATISHSIDLPRVSTLTGQLSVRSEPAGARVSVDDAPMGTAPMTIDGLVPGSHTITLTNDATSIKQTVTINAGATASLVVPMTAPPPAGVPVSGWISVVSPAEVQIYEDGRLLGTSRTDRIMVSAGAHSLEVVNEALAVRSTHSINVTAGKVATVTLEWPKGTMAINANPWADVWVDGERVGETPIGSISVPLGTHEVVFRHPQLGERIVRTTVTATAPARVSIDFKK